MASQLISGFGLSLLLGVGLPRVVRTRHMSCSIFLVRDEIPGDPQRSPLMISPSTDTKAQHSPLHLRNLGTDSASEDGANTYIKNTTRINLGQNCILCIPTMDAPFSSLVED